MDRVPSNPLHLHMSRPFTAVQSINRPPLRKHFYRCTYWTLPDRPSGRLTYISLIRKMFPCRAQTFTPGSISSTCNERYTCTSLYLVVSPQTTPVTSCFSELQFTATPSPHLTTDWILKSEPMSSYYYVVKDRKMYSI